MITRRSIVPVLVSLLASATLAEPPRSPDTPEIGMFAVQASAYWAKQRADPATPGLTGITPTTLFTDAGVSWIRVPLMGYMRRAESGELKFPKDRFLDELRDDGVKIFGTISLGTLPKGSKRQARFKGEPDEEQVARWLDELRALVRHYRGTVWIWQIGNEIEKKPFGADTYVRLFEQGARAIREIDPGVPIAAAGFTAGDFGKFHDTTWPALLEAGVRPDVLDFHFHTYAGRIDFLEEKLTRLVAMRDAELPGAALIMTENSTFTGKKVPYPWEGNRKISQSESDQGAEQVKRAIVALAHGFSVSFGTDMDKVAWQKQAVHPFTQNGLVHTPLRPYRGRARTWPKSAWWSLRLMTLLRGEEGAAPSVARIRDTPAEDVHVFRVGAGTYLAWTDRKRARRIRLELPGIEGDAARVVQAVPRGDGKAIDPETWLDRFPTGTTDVTDGAVTIDLFPTPVWIVAE